MTNILHNAQLGNMVYEYIIHTSSSEQFLIGKANIKFKTAKRI